MPSGKVHDRLTLATGALGAPVVFLCGASMGLEPGAALELAAVWSLSHLASGMLLSPDLDNKTNALKRWGALGFIWAPYRRLVPHRSWVSHGLVIGGLLRLLYLTLALMILILPVLYVCYDDKFTPLAYIHMLHGFYDFCVMRSQVAISFLLGIITGSDVHCIADKSLHRFTTFHRWMSRL